MALFASVVLSTPSRDKTFLMRLSLSTWEEECAFESFLPSKARWPERQCPLWIPQCFLRMAQPRTCMDLLTQFALRLSLGLGDLAHLSACFKSSLMWISNTTVASGQTRDTPQIHAPFLNRNYCPREHTRDWNVNWSVPEEEKVHITGLNSRKTWRQQSIEVHIEYLFVPVFSLQ